MSEAMEAIILATRRETDPRFAAKLTTEQMFCLLRDGGEEEALIEVDLGRGGARDLIVRIVSWRGERYCSITPRSQFA